MQNKLTQVLNDTNNFQEIPLNPLEKAMNNVNEIIHTILPKENQIFLKEKEELRKELLLKLEEEVKKISKSISYCYKGYSADDGEIEKTFQKILKENKNLAKIYDELLSLNITESGKKIMQRILFLKYFEDIVYESMEGENLEKGESSNLLGELLNKNGEEILEIMKALPQGLKKLDLSYNNLGGKLNGQELVELMKALPQGLKKLILGINDFLKEQEEIIKSARPDINIIFK